MPLGDRFEFYSFLRVQMNSYFWNHILFYICLQTPIKTEEVTEEVMTSIKTKNLSARPQCAQEARTV